MRRAALALAIAAGAASAAVSWTTLGGVSHVSDEIAYTFQARILASGAASLPEPPVAPALDLAHVIAKDGVWASMYPPGWPLLLVPGVWLGAPWLVSPILLALSTLGVFALGRALHDGRTGLLAAALFAVSPFVLLHGAGRMAHLPTLCLAVWCAVLLERAVAASPDGRRWPLLAAGALGGAAWLVRPVSAAALLAPLVAAAVSRLRRARPIMALALLAVGAVPFVAIALAFNAAAFGDPFLSGYRVHDPTLRFNGYGGQYLPYGAIFADHFPRFAADLSRYLWGLPGSDLILLAPLLRPRAGRAKDARLFAAAAALVLAWSFYWFHDVVYGGPRLAFEAMGFLAILGARGLLEAGSWLGPLAARLGPRVRVAAASAAIAAVLVWPLAMRLPGELRYHAKAYQGAISDAATARADAAGVGPDALVFVSGPEFAYGTFFEANAVPPDSGGRVFVRDVPALRDRILATWPRREVWQVFADFEALPRRNVYPDAFEVRALEWHRVH